MVNIGITTYNRKKFLHDCIDSILQNTETEFMLFVYDDASRDGTVDMLKKEYGHEGIVIIEGKKRLGVTAGFNALWEVSENFNDYGFFCYLQDDTVVKKCWLKKLLAAYYASCGFVYKVGLLSGFSNPEHPDVAKIAMRTKVGRLTAHIKRSIRATNMMAPYSFWDRIGKIPKRNPDGSERGFPNREGDGLRGRGSNLDVYITGFQSNSCFAAGAAGKNCLRNMKSYCLVLPGLVEHKAITSLESTWGNTDPG